MQSNSAALRRTCGRAVSREQEQCEFMFPERVQGWLEREDTPFAQICAYAVCCFTALYLLGNIIRMALY